MNNLMAMSLTQEVSYLSAVLSSVGDFQSETFRLNYITVPFFQVCVLADFVTSVQ